MAYQETSRERQPIEDLRVFHPKDVGLIQETRPEFRGLKNLVCLNPLTRCHGEVNIGKSQELSLAGKKLILMPNHLSHIDHFFFWVFLNSCDSKRNRAPGESKDVFWDQLVFVARQSLFDETIFKDWLPLVDMIGVVSSREIRELFEKRGKQDREKIHMAKLINKQAQIEMGRILGEGKMLVVYPEGQRSKTGGLMEIEPAVGSILRLADYAVPLGFTGTNYLLPRGKEEEILGELRGIQEALGRRNFLELIPKVVSSREALLRLFTPVTLTVGEPYPIDKEKKDEVLANQAGLKIAELLPSEYQGVYRKELVRQ